MGIAYRVTSPATDPSESSTGKDADSTAPSSFSEKVDSGADKPLRKCGVDHTKVSSYPDTAVGPTSPAKIDDDSDFLDEGAEEWGVDRCSSHCSDLVDAFSRCVKGERKCFSDLPRQLLEFIPTQSSFGKKIIAQLKQLLTEDSKNRATMDKMWPEKEEANKHFFLLLAAIRSQCRLDCVDAEVSECIDKIARIRKGLKIFGISVPQRLIDSANWGMCGNFRGNLNLLGAIVRELGDNCEDLNRAIEERNLPEEDSSRQNLKQIKEKVALLLSRARNAHRKLHIMEQAEKQIFPPNGQLCFLLDVLLHNFETKDPYSYKLFKESIKECLKLKFSLGTVLEEIKRCREESPIPWMSDVLHSMTFIASFDLSSD
jgi:hypothetical protein